MRRNQGLAQAGRSRCSMKQLLANNSKILKGKILNRVKNSHTTHTSSGCTLAAETEDPEINGLVEG